MGLNQSKTNATFHGISPAHQPRIIGFHGISWDITHVHLSISRRAVAKNQKVIPISSSPSILIETSIFITIFIQFWVPFWNSMKSPQVTRVSKRPRNPNKKPSEISEATTASLMARPLLVSQRSDARRMWLQDGNPPSSVSWFIYPWASSLYLA